MIKSMTAYGRAISPVFDDNSSWCVELRSVNSRFFDLQLRVPSYLIEFEDRIKKYLRQKFTRGRINLTITSLGVTSIPSNLIINRGLIKEYRRIVEDFKKELCLDNDPGLISFLINQGLIIVKKNIVNLNNQWVILEATLSQALEEAESMRMTEGTALANDLVTRLDKLESLVKNISIYSPQLVEKYRQQLHERILMIMNNNLPDPQRLAMEIAIIAERCDINEEIVRSLCHIKQFRNFLETGTSVGRKLDFLLQELAREINTIGNKNFDINITQYVLEFKFELERIREQVQNIE